MTATPIKGQHPPSTSGRAQIATTEEVSHYLQVAVRTLYYWRWQGKGPQATRVGRHLRYRWDDVHTWLASQPR